MMKQYGFNIRCPKCGCRSAVVKNVKNEEFLNGDVQMELEHECTDCKTIYYIIICV